MAATLTPVVTPRSRKEIRSWGELQCLCWLITWRELLKTNIVLFFSLTFSKDDYLLNLFKFGRCYNMFRRVALITFAIHLPSESRRTEHMGIVRIFIFQIAVYQKIKRMGWSFYHLNDLFWKVPGSKLCRATSASIILSLARIVPFSWAPFTCRSKV